MVGGGSLDSVLRLMLTRRWLIRHALLVAAVGVFLGLGWWQLQRAGAGNARSIGYAFEWPLLALCAIYWWARTLRSELRPPAEPAEPGAPAEPGDRSTATTRSARPRPAPPADEEPDEELAAYNRYLRALHEQDQRRGR